MTDEDLRSLEREILLEPSSLDLRRRHALLLLRGGDEDRGLAALDLAWRLGAEDLCEELEQRLEARTLTAGALTFNYVPGGPFAMGSDDLDEDASPLHLVHLSPFYIAREPLSRGALDGWRDHPPCHPGLRNDALPLSHGDALEAIAWLEGRTPIEGFAGAWALVSEAQWERVFRASYLRRDGASPYGALPSDRPEWTADSYDPAAYSSGPRRDPAGSGSGPLRVVRGVPTLKAPEFALYREAARPDGTFRLGWRLFGRWVSHEPGIAARVVLVPAAMAP